MQTHRNATPWKAIMAAAAAIALGSQGQALAFGGEELPHGEPWHHYDITLRALMGESAYIQDTRSRTGVVEANVLSAQGAGFSKEAAASIAWHADNLDSYLYNPVWWAQGLVHNDGSPSRLKVAIRSYTELAKLHHDDTFSTAGLEDNWTRYYSGTLAGLVWAAQKKDYAAAYNILGMAAHANQDFYSHSNWVDKQNRRKLTWYDNASLRGLSSVLDGIPSSTPPDPVRGQSNPNFSVRQTGSFNDVITRAPRSATETLGAATTGTTGIEASSSSASTGITIRPDTQINRRVETGSLPNLYSGAYERAENAGAHHHGKYSLSCSVIKGTAVSSALAGICSGASPVTGLPFCISYRACSSASQVELSVLGVSSGDMAYMRPGGIALDSAKISRVGAYKRGLVGGDGSFNAAPEENWVTADQCQKILNAGLKCDQHGNGLSCSQNTTPRTCSAPADYVFATTKLLAIQSTQRMFAQLEADMQKMAPGFVDEYFSFWIALKTRGSNFEERTAQFENFSQVPYQFLSAGPYPVKNAATASHPHVPSSDGWYMRVRIKTADETGAGTDTDVRLRSGGQDFLLDYTPRSDPAEKVSNRLLVYNDFEQGDDDVYTVGPFKDRPSQFVLVNDDAGAGDVAEAIWDDFVHTIDVALVDLRRLGMSLIGGNADLVGTAQRNESFDEYRQRTRFNPSQSSITISGGTEGTFIVNMEERPAPNQLTSAQRQAGWKGIEIVATTLKCVKESTNDRGSNSDEPYLIMTVAPLNGEVDEKIKFHTFGPYRNIDDGMTANLLNHVFFVAIPPDGGYTVAAQLWESDDETSYDRDQLKETFVTGLDEAAREQNGKMLDQIGRFIASDWKVQSIEVTPFKRGATVEVAATETFTPAAWIDGGQSHTVNLTQTPTIQPQHPSSILESNGSIITRPVLSRRPIP